MSRLQSDLVVTPALLQKVNLTQEEYQRILKILGRTPTLTELGIFSVQWSEHCSYKSSKIYLKQFPTKGKRVLVGAGEENAGLIDVGDGVAVAFKVESHNHPSAVEPHAGAATGVGGIIRDIFTMGARPIALFDSLRFGPLNGHGRTKFLFGGVVKGIADYGNCVGIPTVGGEIAFDETYRENPLVNVMCIGVVPADKIARGTAKGIGNPVLYVGSSTGRDGLGGASFASREITEESEADRPAVQLGDPFTEKCLIEATLEALATGDVVGIQDMGAAGLTCSTCETASRGSTGIEIDVARVPRRESGMIPPPDASRKAARSASGRAVAEGNASGGGMTPYEVMLSESQERMLLIVKKGREQAIIRLFARWGLHAVVIGRVTGTGRMRVRDGKTLAADIPVAAITDDAPIYHRPVKRPHYLAKAQQLSLQTTPQPRDYTKALTELLASPTIANKAHVFEQYDHMVQTNTLVLPGRSDAAVLRLSGTRSLLAATTDGNGTYCYLDPYVGGKLAVAEAARNLVCVGAQPLAVTDCLNFANPEDPEIMWQFKECVRGIREACRVFETPVTGGNVSLYNESPKGAIDPTPVIGMVGLIQVQGAPLTMGFKGEGDLILLLGTTREELGGSEYLKVLHHRKQGRPPAIHLQEERRLDRVMLDAYARGLLKSAHDCSEGGLAIALAECCIAEPEHLIGASIEAPSVSMRADAWLFGESAGRIVVSCTPDAAGDVERLARAHQVPISVLGHVGGRRLVIGPWIDVPVDKLNRTWRSALERALR